MFCFGGSNSGCGNTGCSPLLQLLCLLFGFCCG